MLARFTQTLEMIKFSHSVFALPFALGSALLALGGLPDIKTFVMLIAAMVTARSAAMAFNRLVDADIDAANPRTKDRHIPQGKLTKSYVIAFIVINTLLFIFISSTFNRLTLWLSPVALAILFFYSYTKRFTHFAQLFLGVSLGIAPIAAWIAITGSVSLLPCLIGLGVLLWVAGFDIIYAAQDAKFDSQAGLKSMVVALGVEKALKVSRLLHFLSLITLFFAGYIAGMGIPYTIAVSLIGIALAYEHSLVSATDLSRVDAAFFLMNGMVSFIFLLGVVIELFWF